MRPHQVNRTEALLLIVVAVGCFVWAWFSYSGHPVRFLATASVLRAGKRLSFCSGEVRAFRESGEELIATMLSTIITKTV